MMDEIFDKIETDLMKVLTKEPDKSFTQYELYSKLLDELDIKDPIEKENLKIRFLIVLRKLSSIFDNVYVYKKNGCLNAIFKILDTTDDKLDDKKKTFINKDFLEEDCIEEEESKEETPEMPSEIAVIQFIIDEKIEKYYSKKDYDGNSILHKLVMYNDFERFKKVYLRIDLSLDEVNSKNQTPIDLITDMRFSNLLISHLIEINNNCQNDLIDMGDKIILLDKDLFKLHLQTKHLTEAFMLYIIFIGLKYIFY